MNEIFEGAEEDVYRASWGSGSGSRSAERGAAGSAGGRFASRQASRRVGSRANRLLAAAGTRGGGTRARRGDLRHIASVAGGNRQLTRAQVRTFSNRLNTHAAAIRGEARRGPLNQANARVLAVSTNARNARNRVLGRTNG